MTTNNYNISATTTPNAPTVGSWNAGQTIIDSNGIIWSCTIGGTPGTWAQIGVTSGLTLISRQVISSAGPVTFSSIPSTYENLVIEVMGASASAGGNDTLVLQFNGDTTGNYDYVQMNTAGSSVSESIAATQGSMWVGVLPGSARSPSTMVGFSRIVIPSYARTTYLKCARSSSWYMQSAGSQTVYDLGGIWHSTAAINSVTVKTGGASGLDVGTVVTLYGEV